MTDRLLRGGIAVLALAGMAISGYLTYTKYAHAAIFCSTDGGCEKVQSSEYATIAGFLPVPVLGLVGYFLIAVAAILPGTLPRRATIGLATVAAAFSAYLLVLQLWVIDAVCHWCVASEGVAFALFLLALLRIRRRDERVGRRLIAI